MPRIGARLSPILIGRDDLLDLAEARLAEAEASRRQFLLLAGEAGIGKSRLLGAIDTKATAAGFRTAGGFLAPQDRDVPAASFLDMARSMTREEPWNDVGRELLELVERQIGAPNPQRRLLVLHAVDRITAAIDKPTLLAFDDLQWADDLTLEMISELARATRDLPLFLVGAYRTDELAPEALLRAWRSRLLTQRVAEEARLGPLNLEQTALMTTLILDTGLPAPHEVVAAVHERTDGVPLHIEELLAALRPGERVDERTIRAARVPDTLEDAVVQRIHALSPDAQAVARSGAVIGRCFVPEVLAGIMNVRVDSLDAPLRELVDEHVLDPPGIRGLYDFHHQVLRDVLYRSLSAADRRRLHARAGEFGRELEGASEIHASLHFERAGMNVQAFRSALQGARVAARLSMHREAFELYRRAVDNLPRDLPAAEQAGIFDAYAGEALAVEETDTAERASQEALTRFEATGDAIAALRQRSTLLNIARRRGLPVRERASAIHAAIKEVSSLPGPQTSGIRAALMVELAYTSVEAFDLEGAREAIADGLHAASQAEDDEIALWLASIDGMVDVLDGRVDEGLDRIEQVAKESRDRGFEDGGVTAYRDGAVMAARVMAYPRAQRFIDEGLRYADAIEQSHCAHLMTSTAALVAWAQGRWDDAIALGERALADRGCERGADMARWPVGYVALARGDEIAAARHLEAAEAFGRANGGPDLILAASWGLAELALLTGDLESALRRTDEALELATASGERARFAPMLVTGVRARIAAGHPADAERWFREASALFDGHGTSPALDHAAGLLALAAGTLAAARASLERAARGWQSRGRGWEAAWAHLDLASCLMRLGRGVEATRLIAEASELAERLDSPPLRARIAELQRLNRRHASEEPAWHPLTVREYEVARLIASGLTNGEIAGELSVSPRTVGAHVEHVLAKLGAGRRTEIASWVATTVQPTPAPRDASADGAASRADRTTVGA
jgi:DNA-binding CsgD family transcriptional regulator